MQVITGFSETSVVIHSFVHFWHAPLWVRIAPNVDIILQLEWTILSHANCFVQGEERALAAPDCIHRECLSRAVTHVCSHSYLILVVFIVTIRLRWRWI